MYYFIAIVIVKRGRVDMPSMSINFQTDILSKIEREARKRYMSRSAFVNLAVKSFLESKQCCKWEGDTDKK